MRHAELRLGVQAAATQALEGRATSMVGWSVTGGLVLGAAVVDGMHVLAAAISATCLVTAAILCLVAIATRQWSGPGYQPADVLHDPMPTELEALEAMVKGYQSAVVENSRGFRRFKILLNAALILIVAAPILGSTVLALVSQAHAPTRL